MKAEQSGDLYAIDVIKYIMAFCVIAIHTTPLKGIDNYIASRLYESVVSIAVPFFFLSSGYLIGRKIKNRKENDDALVERQQKKIISYYVIWTIIYLPLTIWGFCQAGEGFVKSLIQFIRNVVFQGENYYSWPLWYLLSAMYGLVVLKIIISRTKGKKEFVFCSIGIICICMSMHFATDYIVNNESGNSVIKVLSILIKKTIGKGRMFSGTYYLLIGNLISRSKYQFNKIILVFGFITSYLITAFTSFFPMKVMMCVFFFILVVSLNLRGDGRYFRRSSTIMYYTHMLFFFIFNLIMNKEMYGLGGFTICCITTNVLAFFLNTGRCKNSKLIDTLFGKIS